MKKILLAAVISAMCMLCGMTASALDTATAAGTAGVAANIAYEGKVISTIAGRAGAATPAGAKGIVFEVLYRDTQNLIDVFTGKKTQLTKSSGAHQVDLVKMQKHKVAERIQCKDTPNSYKKVLQQVKSNKYRQAQLVGTKETAIAYNQEAAKQGITKQMKNSGISTKTTGRIAQKSLGQIPTYSNLADYFAKGGGFGAAVGGGICLIESLVNRDDVCTTITHVAVGSTEGLVSCSAAALAGEVATAAVVAVGGPEIVAIAVPVVTACGVAYLVCQAFDYAIDEESICADVEKLMDSAVQLGYTIADFFPEAAADGYVMSEK